MCPLYPPRPEPAPSSSDSPATHETATSTATFDELLAGLHQFLDIDPHGRGTAWLASRLAQTMGMAHGQVDAITAAAATHDIGKIFIPVFIRDKRARLTLRELEIMRHHTWLGCDLLNGMYQQRSDRFDFAIQADVALLHHERWDGRGYPLELKGETIPLEARIVAVADVFDALTTTSSYNTARPVDDAIELISGERGLQFDPACVDALVLMADELVGSRPTLSARIGQGENLAEPEGLEVEE